MIWKDVIDGPIRKIVYKFKFIFLLQMRQMSSSYTTMTQDVFKTVTQTLTKLHQDTIYIHLRRT